MKERRVETKNSCLPEVEVGDLAQAAGGHNVPAPTEKPQQRTIWQRFLKGFLGK